MTDVLYLSNVSTTLDGQLKRSMEEFYPLSADSADGHGGGVARRLVIKRLIWKSMDEVSSNFNGKDVKCLSCFGQGEIFNSFCCEK